jgi:hypothetical protein
MPSLSRFLIKIVNSSKWLHMFFNNPKLKSLFIAPSSISSLRLTKLSKFIFEFCTSNVISSVGLRVNGTTYIANNGAGNSGAGFNDGTYVGTVYDFAATDYVELMGTFNASVTSSSGVGGCQFGAYKIG